MSLLFRVNPLQLRNMWPLGSLLSCAELKEQGRLLSRISNKSELRKERAESRISSASYVDYLKEKIEYVAACEKYSHTI